MGMNYIKMRENKGILFHQPGTVEFQLETLNPGIYKIYNSGTYYQTLYTFESVSVKDNLVKFKTGVVANILDKVERFLSINSTKEYKELGIIQKMGMIFYGPVGTGKSCTAQLVMLELIDKYKAICLDASHKELDFIIQSIEKIRSVQANPIVIFMDEVENNLKKDEESYLTFLDGVNSYDRVIFMGCTNYLDKIPDRIKKRKSRIKHLFEIKSLPIKVYEEYILSKLKNISKNDLTKFTYLAEESGLTIDELKHAVIDYRIEGSTIEEAVKEAKTYFTEEEVEKE